MILIITFELELRQKTIGSKSDFYTIDKVIM